MTHKKVKRPSIHEIVRALRPFPTPKKLRRPDKTKPSIIIEYHRDNPDPNEKLANAFFGRALGEDTTGNWYGSFSSGNAGLIKGWYLAPSDFTRLHAIFYRVVSKHKPYEDVYEQLQVTRGNGNLGSRTIGFDATPENIQFVKDLLSHYGFTYTEKSNER